MYAPNPTSTSIAYTSCYETGYLRISGILLPRPHIEITDPPPALNSNFSVNGSTFALNSRLAYGDTELERSNTINWRNGNALYVLYNVGDDIAKYSATKIINGSVPVSISNQTSIPINASTLSSSSNNTGTVFKFNISTPPSLFPSYTLITPSAYNYSYYWIHKATTTLYDIPQQNSFPAVIVCEPEQIKLISGEIINFNNNPVDYGIDGLAYGGYIPHSICFNGICPPGYTDEPYFTESGVQWSARNYIPTISGIILQNPVDITGLVSSANYTVNPITSDKILSINNQSNSIQINDIISVSITRTLPLQSTILLDTFITGVTSNNIDNTNLIFNRDYGLFNIDNLSATIRSISLITEIDTNNHILTIQHNNMALQSGDMVAINNLLPDNQYVSSTQRTIDNNSYIQITDINTTGLKLQIQGSNAPSIYSGLNIGDAVNIYKIIEDNIKIMPYNIFSNTEGKYDFIISGRANILHGQYLYRIVTKENSNMPIFKSRPSDGGIYENMPYPTIVPKFFERDIPMYVSKPIEISSHTISWIGNAWTLQLVIDNGALPLLSELIDVTIDIDGLGNYTYCGFDRPASDSVNNNQTIINLSSNTRINWSSQTAFTIRVSDSTGSDTVSVIKPS